MSKRRRLFVVFVVIVSFISTLKLKINAGEIDLLLDRLVDKGVLSGTEAQQIRYENEELVKKEISLQTHRTLPLWLQSVTIGGDIRIRYQKENNIRSRIRERLRLYLTSKVNENVFAYAGIATGEDSDSRSTNQTFTGNFSKKNVWLDYAYIEYYPYYWLSFTAGKIKQALWSSNDVLWDSDINQEGGLLKAEKVFSSNFRNYLYSGFFVIRENKSSKEQYFNYFSDLISLQSEDGFSKLNLSLSYYDFKNIKGNSELPNRPKSDYIKANSTLSEKYLYNYRNIVFDVEFSRNIEKSLSFFMFNVNNITLFSTYVRNTAISSKKNNDGWLLGFKVGQEKVAGPWDFSLSYSRRWIEADAWLDTYPDSDFYGGATDVKGDEVIFTFGLGRDYTLTLDYYNSKTIKSNKKGEELFQLDLNVKF